MRKAAARPLQKAGARAGGIDSVRSVDELMAYAYALEIEASERYADFAEVMEAHNNREVAELFRKLARIEHKHGEQILEEMGWTSPPKPPSTGYRWESPEGPETGEVTDLHYLMQPYHALQIALHNEKRAQKFFAGLVKKASTASVRKAAAEFMEEEAEHVHLVEEWLARTPKPAADWAHDPDPPVYND
ncbi:MAG: ferritin family protein [Burkholderiales bacterium]|jgi:rubrerythrin|nr:ferritin family protein [Burkholderiales bacterium]